jgi:GTP:adenosylcobinamide-phosphate guanylyltransferase
VLVNAVITAGGLVDADFARTIGTNVKALAPIGGATMLDRAIDAARGAGVENLAVIGGTAVRERCAARVERVVDSSEDGGENVLRALAVWSGTPLLYLTSDIPFVTPQAVRDFAQRSAQYAVTMPLAEHDAYTRRFPGAPEHVVELGGERVANGNVFFIAPEAIEPLRSWATRFFAARKSKIGMAQLLGPALLLRFVFGKLTIGAIERKAVRALGMPVAAVRDAAPELSYDVDTLADYLYAREALEETHV